VRVAIVGQGYVGLPVAVRAVEAGHHVVGLDVDRARVDALRAGTSYVEDVPSSVVGAALATGRYTPTTDPHDADGFDVAVISVPTPLRDGTPDLSHVETAAEMLAPAMRTGCCVILESTTYPGTTEEVVGPILEKGSGLIARIDFHLGYSPERIDPGNAEWSFARLPKIVSGIDEPSLKAIQAFYDTLVERTVPVSSTRVAELVKLLENTFRHVNIALINEFAMFANDLGIDIWEAIDAAATKPFGFMPFRPGPGVGGHCLPVDPSYISWRVRRQLRVPFRFVELANEVNDQMPYYVVRRVLAALNRHGKCAKGSRVLLLGLAYKPNTGDARESPAVQVAEGLAALEAEISIADPHVRSHPLYGRTAARATPTAEVIARSDAVVLLTDHDAFDYDLVVAHAPYILDTRNRLSGPQVEHL
jgi:UDP-N-acetyl-D-glucosamine dehydrogenase